MTLNFIHSGMCTNDLESSLYRLNKTRRSTSSSSSTSLTQSFARRFSNEILDFRLNICSDNFFLIFNVEENVRKNTFEMCKTKPMLFECRTSQPFEHLPHINNRRALTCCSHRFCLKDFFRALTLIGSVLMINFLLKYQKCLKASRRQ